MPVARPEALTGSHVGPHWFDWMVWQQGHPEFAPYPGYAGFLADLDRVSDSLWNQFTGRPVVGSLNGRHP